MNAVMLGIGKHAINLKANGGAYVFTFNYMLNAGQKGFAKCFINKHENHTKTFLKSDFHTIAYAIRILNPSLFTNAFVAYAYYFQLHCNDKPCQW